MITPGALRFYSGTTWASWVYRESIITVFGDGCATEGIPPDTEEFRRSAKFLGYGDDIYWHMIEHDLLHMMVADALGIRSGAMHWQAHNPDAGATVMPPAGKLEEQRLTAVQCLLNNTLFGGNSWAISGWENLVDNFGTLQLRYLIDDLRLTLRTPEPMTSRWAREASTLKIPSKSGTGFPVQNSGKPRLFEIK